MSIANLTRYHTNAVGMDGHVEMFPFHTGEWVKFEEAVEASSNSLQQLKAEIAALVDEVLADEKARGLFRCDDEILKRLRQLSAV